MGEKNKNTKLLVYMGNGTLVDGVRRWFQRRTATTTTGLISSGNNSKLDDSNNNSSSNDRQVSVISEFNANQINHQQQQGELHIEFDFDLSGLKPIQVPKRAHISRFPLPMDPHKKVLHFVLFLFWFPYDLIQPIGIVCEFGLF